MAMSYICTEEFCSIGFEKNEEEKGKTTEERWSGKKKGRKEMKRGRKREKEQENNKTVKYGERNNFFV